MRTGLLRAVIQHLHEAAVEIVETQRYLHASRQYILYRGLTLHWVGEALIEYRLIAALHVGCDNRRELRSSIAVNLVETIEIHSGFEVTVGVSIALLAVAFTCAIHEAKHLEVRTIDAALHFETEIILLE